MKKLLIIAIITIYNNNYAQINFQDHIIIDDEGGTNGASSVYATDIDGDGDMDMLSASSHDDKIAWYENTDGMGTFGNQQIISTNADGANTVIAADIDGDGDMDVVSASRSDNKIAWYENTDGLGNFSTEQIITTNANSLISIYLADFDGDNDIDIVSASLNDDKIAWYKNLDGQGTFSNEQIISTDEPNPTIVLASDLDNDGDMDIISTFSDTIAWFENIDGLGLFGTKQIITSNAISHRTLETADIDGDGDLDVISTSFPKVVWFENLDGNGNFGTEQTLINNIITNLIYSSDIDNDGDMDLILDISSNKIVWYENTDSLGTYNIEHIITTNVDGFINFIAEDIDNDGKLDVLSASNSDDKIAWYKNVDGSGNFGVQQIVNSIDGANGPNEVFLIDLDSDGDNDIISSSYHDDKISWYENLDGLGSFGSQQIISSNVDKAKSVYAIDIDNDGDNDVLATSYGDGKVVWFKNLDGLGNFSSEQIIFSYINDATNVFSIDIDGDGNFDVVTSSNNGGSISWFRNTDGLGNFGPEQLITSDALFTESIYATDLDGDNDIDILSASYGDDKIVWYENTDGLGAFGEQQIISTNVLLVSSVFAEDIDNDGDMDVISASYGDDKIAWYENTDGLGTFGSQQIISTIEDGAYSVYARDIDNDGDIDICVAAFKEQSIGWYENLDGQGSFGSRQIIADINGVMDVVISDINGDGKLDVISASFIKDQITWHENQGVLAINENTTSNFSIHPNPTKDILNIELENSQIKSIKIYNKLGQLVKSKTNQNTIDISKLSKGLYFVKIENTNGYFGTKKVIKK